MSRNGYKVITNSIRLIRKGCTNRPFYHIVVQKTRDTEEGPVIEYLGSYDPLPNAHGEKLTAVNFDRVRHWIAEGSGLSEPAAELLGLSGFLPLHPSTYIKSWRASERLKSGKDTPDQKLPYFRGIAPLPNPKAIK
uniref:Small ribosomal subunit protein bS16m n=1 Tax=Lynceus sp. MCZ IZ 141354 TaxID=1930659 RepID=A0A9N6WTP2_9CRUS|nr:EOG090X0KAD [Lynceus sp. MCZ IZ 141354]